MYIQEISVVPEPVLTLLWREPDEPAKILRVRLPGNV